MKNSNDSKKESNLLAICENKVDAKWVLQYLPGILKTTCCLCFDNEFEKLPVYCLIHCQVYYAHATLEATDTDSYLKQLKTPSSSSHCVVQCSVYKA